MSEHKHSRSMSTSEKIQELQKKTMLLEGDRKAFHESAKYKIENNEKKIGKMRKENKELHQRFAESLTSDQDAINETLGENNKRYQAALRDKTIAEANKIMNNKKCDALKRLNRQKFQTEEMRKKVEEMKKKQEQEEEEEKRAQEDEDGESEAGRRKRELENSCKKAEMKIQEAENITSTYKKILDQMEQEALNQEQILDEKREDIECNKEELRKLKEMQADAESSRDAARNQLNKQDERLKREKKEREEKLKELRKQAEEKKQMHDKLERKNRSAAANANAGNVQDQESSAGSGAGEREESEKKISNYREAFLRIKEATGVDDVDEVVERFRTQEDTYLNLEEQKKKNAEALETLHAEKKAATERKTSTRYNCETKGSRGERILEEAQAQLDQECKIKEDSEETEAMLTQYYIDACSSVEHLDIKLKHRKSTKSQEPKVSPSAEDEDYVLDLAMVVEDKLLNLREELGDQHQLDALDKEAVEGGGAQSGATTTADYHYLFEDCLPKHNTRVPMPTTNKEQTTVYDDVDSGEDEECLTREQLKKRSEDLVNSKTKRKPQKKKKKGVK